MNFIFLIMGMALGLSQIAAVLSAYFLAFVLIFAVVKEKFLDNRYTY